MKFSSLLILVIGILVFLPVSDSFALRQMAGIPEIVIYPGETEEFIWGLVSDNMHDSITVNIRTEGSGSEFLVYPESILLEPGITEYVTILVEVPEDHDGIVKNYSPSLYATELGEKDGAVVINISMEKKVNITITEAPADAPVVVQQQQIKEDKTDSDNKGGGCLIATAVYGTEMAPQIQMLREIRDDKLMQTEAGSFFMDSFNMFYYSVSPLISDYQRENNSFNKMVQIIITPMVSTLYIMEYADTELQVISLGIGVIALNGLFYGVMPAAAVLFTRKVLQK